MLRVATDDKPQPRARGAIETLPSGSLRVKKVYARSGPGERPTTLSHRGDSRWSDVAARCGRCLNRLLAQVDERLNPRTNVTVSTQLVEKHLGMLQVMPTTLSGTRATLVCTSSRWSELSQ